MKKTRNETSTFHEGFSNFTPPCHQKNTIKNMSVTTSVVMRHKFFCTTQGRFQKRGSLRSNKSGFLFKHKPLEACENAELVLVRVP